VGGLSNMFSFSFSFYFICQPLKGGRGGTRRPHRDWDLRGIRSGGENGFAMIYRTNAEVMKQKKSAFIFPYLATFLGLPIQIHLTSEPIYQLAIGPIFFGSATRCFKVCLITAE